MTLDLVWEDPPKPVRTLKHVDIAEALRANPGQWALWPHALSGTNACYNLQRDIRNGVRGAFPRGEFEASARVAGGDWKLYIRFIGQPQPAVLRVVAAAR